MWSWRRSDEDFAEEIRANIALETDRLIAEGMNPEDARKAARRAFGNVARAHERFYQSRRLIWLDDLQRDIRYACRTLVKNPGFAVVVVVTLALGIGANTAIFSVINGVLLRPLPYHEADRLVQVMQNMPPAGPAGNTAFRAAAVNNVDFDTRRGALRTLQSATGSVFATATLLTADDAVRLEGSRITASVFPLLGVQPALGRSFNADEEAADTIVVLSDDTWRRHFCR